MNHLSVHQQQFLTQLAAGLRPGQDALAQWRSGEMAIAAVPGSGKSHALAVAAVLTLARQSLHHGQQLVIVTFTRAAAEGIKQKILTHLKAAQLPVVGFSVQTIHGLALQIASRHPEVSGVDLDSLSLQDIPANHPILRAAVEQWIQAHGEQYERLCQGARSDQEKTEQLRRRFALSTEILPDLAHTVIHESKSSNLSPQAVAKLGETLDDPYQSLAIAAGIYQNYQQLLQENNVLDYDDLVLGAIRVLQQPELQQYWQGQIYGIFEDEAQDSSPLQEQLIRLLATAPESGECNLVRVGDPNQAINSTFTPADPFYFNRFCQAVDCAEIHYAGRSSLPIITAANQMLHWASHTLSPPDRFAFRWQEIFPVPNHDPQQNANPDPTGAGVERHYPQDIYATVQQLGDRLETLLTENPDHSAAILVRKQRQAKFVTEQLRARFQPTTIRLYDARSGNDANHLVLELYQILRFLERPHSPDCLKGALDVLGDRQKIPTQDLARLATYPEKFLYPGPLDPALSSGPAQATQTLCVQLLQARWQLPHYQLLPFLAMTLDYSDVELATVQKLAERIAQQTQGQKNLRQSLEVFEMLLRDGFEGIELDTDARYTRPQQITVITMHKAKGLDWDYVFIPFLHDSEIPGMSWVPSGAQFLGDYNLAQVARAQIRHFVHGQDQGRSPTAPATITTLWQEAQQLKTEEEYRLLYVAMTRAKRLLWLSAAKQAPFSWSTFKPHQSSLQSQKPCPIFDVLQGKI
ncbi:MULTISPECIES: ATP-dependent helicase [Cyanophyceae]|uniref:ATP-dependent helicase n=1 Tax=Cyanophyceae TaxID=3028117 RepID=UPI00016DCC7C|nr:MULTISPECIES: ATP-dependent helicase [Cyanophyceae]ACB00087.1 UvrD/REP helicase domain protein [Picosynechococcus sp. PCC 7002]SMH53731.1 DNA helicase-2 / ATP-dependent DNA helicase PcrA [Picosynechococcus sp. OG1]SMQ82733.1 DNA helicase-2 / ATP-dependent DNA helicase PcrA [Synechococcus sp. 7002]